MKKNKISIIFFILLYMVLVIAWSDDISLYVLNSIKSCINVIIPSMYIFIIISDFLIVSNIYTLFGKPFSLLYYYFRPAQTKCSNAIKAFNKTIVRHYFCSIILLQYFQTLSILDCSYIILRFLSVHE